ncbi:glucagon receptor isoform X5 [Sagmatias obliquidens]|uniref:glucagon receptor isoform X5 n=1 Tax=Sagmatias obliquidens TaxID=3371155 RepID=UPI000F43F8EB|nr:glucagon receptor isoform X5 [Lagenorhynchus obliquidens]
MPPILPRCPHLLLLLLLACQPQAPSAQVMDFLFEKWKLYGDQCLHNLSLLPPPTELVCNRTFDKYSCWPDTPPNTTANISCPWYLPWHHKVQHRLVFKRCGPDGQWVRGPRGQPWRNASQCQMDDKELEVQKEVAKMYSSFQVMYTVGYSLSLGALLLALAILLGLSKLHCTRNYIHVNLFASFVLKASSVLVIDTLLKTRYSQRIGDDFSVSVWLSDGVPPCCSSPPGWWSSVCLRTSSEYLTGGPAGGFASPGWEVLGWPRGEWPCGSECGSGSGVSGQRQWGALSKPGSPGVEVIGNYLPSFPEALIRSQGIRGWGATRLPGHKQAPPCRCWTSNDNMGFWWILRFPVFLAILINFFIFIRILHLLVAKLQAHQMRYTDYKFRWVWALGVGGRQAACGIPGARGSVGGGGGTRAPGGAGLVAQSLPPQAGQVHADPHPPVGGPRGGVCLCDRRACPGHPALRQALLRPLPQLLPGACPPLNQQPNPQASLGAALTSPISPGPAGGCSLLFPQQGGAVGVAAALASLA